MDTDIGPLEGMRICCCVSQFLFDVTPERLSTSKTRDHVVYNKNIHFHAERLPINEPLKWE